VSQVDGTARHFRRDGVLYADPTGNPVVERPTADYREFLGCPPKFDEPFAGFTIQAGE